MRQVKDTLVWLAMIVVVVGVIYVVPRLASYVDAATSEHGPDCVTCRNLSLSHRTAIAHHPH
jgi:hypothetical protein